MKFTDEEIELARKAAEASKQFEAIEGEILEIKQKRIELDQKESVLTHKLRELQYTVRYENQIARSLIDRIANEHPKKEEV